MAQPLHYSSFLLVSSFLALSFSVAFSSKNDYPGLKSLHFTLYDRELFNKTSFMVMKGVDTGVKPPVSTDFGPFGSLYAFHDSLSLKLNQSSNVGVIQGIAVATSLDGLQTTNIFYVTLSLKNYKGSITFVGGSPIQAPGDFSVVGGTGDFMFVQGYMTLTPLNLTFPVLNFKLEFHLYWPPYATQHYPTSDM